jgi:cellobiose phosphorylase
MNIKNSLGLSFEFLENGSVKSIDADNIRISLKAATLFSKSGTNLWLRKREDPMTFTALLGPESNSCFTITEKTYIAAGRWMGLDYKCILELSGESLSWQWRVEIENNSPGDHDLDLIYVQDIGLKPVTSGPVNEYYVSQYLERSILEDKNFGKVICCRQNMKETEGNPWLMMSCPNRAVSASVDGMQFYGRTYRATGIPEGLISDSNAGGYAGESSVLALRESPFALSKGDKHTSVFVSTCLADHARATSDDDLMRLPDIMNEFSRSFTMPNSKEMNIPVRNLFNTSSFLITEDLDDEELVSFFGKERRHGEYEGDRLISFFYGHNNHVMLRLKEILADRPHGHIMQAEAGLVPDERILSTTAYGFGIFNSHLTQGNTNFNILLSVCTSQFNLSPETGQRIFVSLDGLTWLLGVPSAFEMGLNHCRWIYKYGNHCFEVRSWTSKSSPQVNLDFRVVSGEKVKLILSNHFDVTNGWKIFPGRNDSEYVARPSSDSMIAAKFPAAQFIIRVQSEGMRYITGGDELISKGNMRQTDAFLILDVPDTMGFCLSFIGEVCGVERHAKIEDVDEQFISDCYNAQRAWNDLSMNLSVETNNADISAIREIMPWYGMNALTHYLTPHGLEQFGGAAWGTRDVTQGPFDLLLSLSKHKEAARVLKIIFSNQNTNGSWPQWWMFDSYHEIRADSAHGDIIYWCLIALSNYIRVTDDRGILDEVLPYYHSAGAGIVVSEKVSSHADRVIRMIIDSFIPSTALVPFGGGDWNDSLQPVSKELAQRMISSWTVEMNYQAFMQYSVVCEYCGNKAKADELRDLAERIRADFNRLLVRDGCVSGYGIVEKDNALNLLLHPTDKITGIHYSILPMERGILSEIFTPDQVRHHQDLIEEHLKGPDGARLMDRPLKYRGGIQTFFRRAESSTFFGREIGLMYVHEHIRYAESLARAGRAEAFVKALRQAIPVSYRDVVPCADIRQSNCYYSSSDVIFSSRYEADELYDEVKKGTMTVRGGWRVYSSGPGIYLGIIISRLFGLRFEFRNVIIDPVMPRCLDGLSVSIRRKDRNIVFRYIVHDGSFSPKTVRINGNTVSFRYEPNKYRKGGAVIPEDRFYEMLDQHENVIETEL